MAKKTDATYKVLVGRRKGLDFPDVYYTDKRSVAKSLKKKFTTKTFRAVIVKIRKMD